MPRREDKQFCLRRLIIRVAHRYRYPIMLNGVQSPCAQLRSHTNPEASGEESDLSSRKDKCINDLYASCRFTIR